MILPSPINFNIESGVSTDPIKLEIHSNPVQLVISAGLTVKVAKSDYLDFKISFSAGITEATFSAEMDGTWANPLGISPKVTISNVEVSVDIIYEQFFTTGVPRYLAMPSLAFCSSRVFSQRFLGRWQPWAGQYY